jgi:3-hydroxyacyl-[acyl-carrier-protein] dehydratase
MVLNKEQVMSILPHRDPFLFVDSIDELILINGEKLADGKTIKYEEQLGCIVKASYHTSPEHPIFAGHFPGNPILPGVVQVEMMAQASCFTLVQVDPNVHEKDLEVALLRVENAKFRKPVVPDMKLEIKCVCTKVRGMFVEYDCSLYHKGQLMSEATVFASVKING